MNNVGVIDTFLNTFTTYIDSGFGLIKGEVGYLSSTLIVIDITLAGLFCAWGADEDILQRLVKKTLYIGFFAFIINNFNNLSAIVFNALIIIALIPLSLRGVRYKPTGAASILRRNLLVYGLGGILVPFIGIILIDLAVNAIGLV